MKRKRKAAARRQRAAGPQLDAVLERIRERRHFDFRNYKRVALERRIERRMAERRCRTYAEYLKLIEKDRGEIDALISTMLIKVTGFFRDPELWDDLSRKIIPQILADKREGEEIRVWCAGCASGEEAYSVAMILARLLGPSFSTRNVKVFGTDVDERAIATARQAVYTREQVAAVPRQLVEQFFVEEHGGLSVVKEIRRCVVFGVNNLVSDAPISRLDLLLCRNVFIYLDTQLQKRVLTRFHYALRHGGVLVLGKSELMPLAAKLFETVDRQRRIYRKDAKPAVTGAPERPGSAAERPSPATPPEASTFDSEKLARFHRDVLESLRTPVIVTSVDGTVLLWNSAARALWARDADDMVGKKLSGLAPPGLSGDLLIEKTAAVREGKFGDRARQRNDEQAWRAARDPSLRRRQRAARRVASACSTPSTTSPSRTRSRRTGERRATSCKVPTRSWRRPTRSCRARMKSSRPPTKSCNRRMRSWRPPTTSCNPRMRSWTRPTASSRIAPTR